MDNIWRPPVTQYLITHNISASGPGCTASLTVTSPAAIIPLNGVPSGHYYVAVAAVNIIVGVGESNQKFVTGMTLIMLDLQILCSMNNIK